ncbi:hypothetical protein PR202_ga29843 [Eleusine coracana subsp. coracana]|uniref:Reverse transcriptase n=1 Tax=Eleusine coracana subsp. coracana TaxID=191504 RepID=A0AAV5DN60_ELECO|nr:hypothetical protein PR202_ga29843 [Eleusine coracana subsp. coracana]
MHADKRNAKNLKAILTRYCKSSGQKFSVEKSSIFFSENTNVAVTEEVCTSLNIMKESLNDKYLGLPALVGADRSDHFRHLVDIVRERINGWKENMLSMRGKEVLIKSIAQAVPVYAMMVFKIPQNIYKGIADVISQYW